MPSIEWNKKAWEGCIKQDGEGWSEPWGSSEAQWFGSLYPRLHRFLPADNILEIAPGWGRWTKFLLTEARSSFRAVDISPERVAVCNEQFKELHKDFLAIANDGENLSLLADRKYDFIFSFDSLVHVDSITLEKYIKQILMNLLSEDGVCFIHHSNMKDSIRKYNSKNPHSRDIGVDSNLVREIITRNGGKILLQEIVHWGDPRLLAWLEVKHCDGLSIFTRADSTRAAASENIIINRKMITGEAEHARTIFDFYSFSEKSTANNKNYYQNLKLGMADVYTEGNFLWDEPLKHFEWANVTEYSESFRGDRKIEMSSFDSRFLCGLVHNHRPQKILEVGIAAGGTTCLLLKSLQLLGLDASLHSVDINHRYYANRDHATGYMVGENFSEPLPHWHLHTGRVVGAYLEEIGAGIDFCILDTAHTLPGELLDFLMVLPYLKDGAVVVIHDIHLHLLYKNLGRSYATHVLFQSVVAEKILVRDESNLSSLPNIAAIVVDHDTRQHITNVIMALSMPWSYIPNNQVWKDTLGCLANHYSRATLNYIKEVINAQQTVHRRDQAVVTKPQNSTKKKPSFFARCIGLVKRKGQLSQKLRLWTGHPS